MLTKITELADLLVAAAQTSLRVAHGEADTSLALISDAQTFLKLYGKRLGRDFKLYEFMGRVVSPVLAWCAVLEEIVLPLKTHAPQAFTVGIDFLKGINVGADHQAAWNDLLTDLAN